MNLLLVCLTVVLATTLLWYRRKTRSRWRQVASMIDILASGQRPASFIIHGEPMFRRIGLGLEELADRGERLEKQISQEEFNIRAILSSMVDGVMVVDTARRIRLFNSSFLTVFELKTAPLGQSALQTLRNAAIEEVIRTTLSVGAAQSREIAVSGLDRYLAMSAAPVRDSAGTALGVAVIFHDITRLKKLEEVRREFVANVSHELRTPLSIFQGYLEMLQEDPDIPREELVRSLHVLRKHSRRLNAVVEDLLTLARLESRNFSLELTPVRLGEFLRGIKEDWALKFSAKEVRFRLEVEPELPEITADSFRLEQVLHNLLENALKYTPAQGEVAVIAKAVPKSGDSNSIVDAIELRIVDTGSGIPPADLPHIFQRFYRADKARSRALGGTGLGLSIVKHIVQLHRGNVYAESTYGKGTAVVISLPAAQASAPEDNTAATTPGIPLQ